MVNLLPHFTQTAPYRRFLRAVAACLCCTLGACSLFQSNMPLAAEEPPAASFNDWQGPMDAARTDPEFLTRQMLLAQAQSWQGVPYRLGGTSREGIDCSAFVGKTFDKYFGQSLPRTTTEQAKLGERVTKEKLRPGDLVFFKINKYVQHVGIYIDNGRFLHASSSQGVMISELDNRYWQGKYWKAVRVAVSSPLLDAYEKTLSVVKKNNDG